jgi:fibronectin type 3 domain-containing protein
VSNTEIDLSWTAASGTVSSYNVFRGTAQGGESATPVATLLTATSFADKSLSAGTEYWYEVTAINATGQGPESNESSATTTAPSVKLATAVGSSTSATVSAGQTATYQLVLTTANYSGTITFSCAGAPAGDTCTVPAAVSITSASSTTQVKISVQTASASARIRQLPYGTMLALAGGLVIVPLFFRRRRIAMMVAIVGACAMLLGTGSCGGGSGGGNSKPPPVVSTLTISASGTGVTTATQVLTLTVQ